IGSEKGMDQSRIRFSLCIAVACLGLCITGCGGRNLQDTFQSTSPGTSTSPSSTSFSITLLPASADVIAGQRMSFTHPFVGSVTWEVNGIPGGDSVHGNIDAVGNYTAPGVPPTGAVRVSARLGAFASSPEASATVSVLNPAPRVDLVSPAVAFAATAAPTLTISGSGFNASSQILLDGDSIPTTYIDSAHLSAALPDAVMQVAGSGRVSVSNP